MESGRNSFFSFFSSAKPSLFQKTWEKLGYRERGESTPFYACFFGCWFLVVLGWVLSKNKQTSRYTKKREEKFFHYSKLRVWNARGREREIEESLSYTHTHVYSFIAQRER